MNKKIIILAALAVVVVLGVWMITKPPAPAVNDRVITVNLYYHNSQMDPNFEGLVFPVQRQIEAEERIQDTIRKTIELLISGNLTAEEIDAGYSTEFPHPDFRLIDLSLSGGHLTLTFTEVMGFTTGGSLRVGILAEGIRQTALQFREVENVIIEPEGSIFQP